MPRLPVATILIVSVITLAGLTATAWSASEESALKQLDNPVTGDATLGKLMGRWTGEGIVRQSPNGRDEPVKCRLNSDWAAETKLLHMNLSCRGIDYVFSATSYIGRSGSIYRGSMNSSVSGESNVAGKRSGNGLTFNMVRNSPKGPVYSSLSLVIAGDKVVDTVHRTDPQSGEKYQALQVTMTR